MRLWCLGVLLTVSCTSRPVMKAERPAGCADAHGGQRLSTPDGASVWFKAEGQGVPVLYLHGGPGHHSRDFERAMGPVLSKRLQLIVMDQRGCGRSGLGASSEVSMEAIVEDIDRVRRAVGAERLVLLAHSFGGTVAVRYARTHPDQLAGLILVDTNADVAAAFTHQLATLATTHPELASVRDEAGPVFPRLIQAYQRIGPLEAQRELQWGSDAAQQEHEALEGVDPIRQCGSPRLVNELLAQGWLDGSRAASLQGALPVPAVVFAGRRSNAIGPTLERDARMWGAPVVWFDASAHFPFLEERERFAREVEAFVQNHRENAPVPARAFTE